MRARDTLTSMRDCLAECLRDAQREGAIAGDADADALANLLLAVLRGMEALGEAGVSARAIRDAADQALTLLPKPSRRRTRV